MGRPKIQCANTVKNRTKIQATITPAAEFSYDKQSTILTDVHMAGTLAVIKLGGGLITDKTKPLTAKLGRIRRLAAEIAEIHKTGTVDILLGTGAGSFGHFTAHEYGLSDGAQTTKQLLGMCIAHDEVRRLNMMVVEALVARDAPAFAVSPAGMMTCEDGAISTAHIEPVQLLLKNHCIPVVHGDTICDATRGTTICSTEIVLNACLAQLKDKYDSSTVIYAMNEDGILDESGQVIPQLSSNDAEMVFGTLAHDVTGGVAGKVREARAALDFADRVYIVGGNTPGILSKAIAGEKVGTRVIR